MQHGPLLRLADAEKQRLKLLYLAKWAEADGTPDAKDGTHATYHAEMRDTMRALGFNVEAASKFDRLYTNHNYDFCVTMLNRGGFTNSEMLGPLLCAYNNIPFFGASPILRGLGDDKHLMKLAVRARGVKTPDSMIIRRGGMPFSEPEFEWKSLIVKPNASSASWGIGAYDNWAEAKAHADRLLSDGHDVIIENFVDGYEIAVPIIGSNGPWVLPPMRFYVDDPRAIRSYEQKRHLAATDTVKLVPLPAGPLRDRVVEASLSLLPEVWPCDIGRVELKYDEKTDTLNFIEINLSCNLWSKKATALSAATIGVTHPQLLETLLCHSLRRQGVVAPESILEYAIEPSAQNGQGEAHEW